LLRFIVSLTVTAACIAGILLWSVDQGWLGSRPSFAWPSLLLLFFTTTLIYSYLHKSKDSGFFTQFYLLSMIIKLIAYMGYCYFVIIEDKPQVMQNIVFFMVVYFVFTILEVGFLYSKVAGKSKS
jgi:hypothetical protein